VERLTSTGTLLVSFRVIDPVPFRYEPGNFVGIDCELPGLGYRRSPYCIFSAPNGERTFQNLVRVVPEGPVSNFIGSLEPGDVIGFRGPTGRSMVPPEEGSEIILLATGVGLGPFHSLLGYLLERGFSRPLRLFWGLRLPEDICLTGELDELARRHPNFSYQISLSQPPAGWQGLRGRLTESVPPLLTSLGGKHFYLCGNGAMIVELSLALSDLGVPQARVYEEYFFNFKYSPDEARIAEIRKRCPARDLPSPLAELEELMGRFRFTS
jgi:ferredoxin-NADP reductase